MGVDGMEKREQLPLLATLRAYRGCQTHLAFVAGVAFLLTAVLCRWLPEVVASAALTLCAPVMLFVIVGFPDRVEVDLEHRRPLEDLQAKLLCARDAIAVAEKRKEEAVKGSSVDRSQLCKLRGELTALTGAEDRVRFLLARAAGGDDAGNVDVALNSLKKEADRARRDSLVACRACEGQRMAMVDAVAKLESLQARSREREAEIENALQQREAEAASCQSLSEESAKLRTEISRLKANLTTLDARLVHARRELKLKSGGHDAEQRRLQAELATGLHKKNKELKTEAQELKRFQGEQQFVTSIAEKLRSLLQDRTAEVADLQERTSNQESELQSLRETIASKQDEVAKLKELAAASPVAGAGDTLTAVAEDEAQVDAAKTKGKTAKQSKGKRRKGSDEGDPTNTQLEDLELELAQLVAAREAAEQQADVANTGATGRLAKSQAIIAKEEAERQEMAKRLEMLKRDAAGLAGERGKMLQAMASHKARVDELEKQAKDAERDKIRLKLDIKRAQDAANQSPQPFQAVATAVPSAVADSNVASCKGGDKDDSAKCGNEEGKDEVDKGSHPDEEETGAQCSPGAGQEHSAKWSKEDGAEEREAQHSGAMKTVPEAFVDESSAGGVEQTGVEEQSSAKCKIPDSFTHDTDAGEVSGERSGCDAIQETHAMDEQDLANCDSRDLAVDVTSEANLGENCRGGETQETVHYESRSCQS